MISKDVLKAGFEISFRLYEELVENLDDDQLPLRLSTLPSNSIGQQMWCVIGARESYCTAVVSSKWRGFNCSLDYNSADTKKMLLSSLKSSSQSVRNLIDQVDIQEEIQSEMLLALYGHESQHHGQLIRYLYSNKMVIPEGWKKKYAL